MKITEMKTAKKTEPLPTTCYGNHPCVYCRLTVAEYINGKSYLLPDGNYAYAHVGCQMDHSLSIANKAPILKKG
jgi:hypothetical protein